MDSFADRVRHSDQAQSEWDQALKVRAESNKATLAQFVEEVRRLGPQALSHIDIVEVIPVERTTKATGGLLRRTKATVYTEYEKRPARTVTGWEVGNQISGVLTDGTVLCIPEQHYNAIVRPLGDVRELTEDDFATALEEGRSALERFLPETLTKELVDAYRRLRDHCAR